MKPALRGIVLPTASLAFVALVALGAGYATAGSSNHERAFATDESPQFVRGVVQSVSGNQLTLSTANGPATFRMASDVQVEALRPAAPAQITIGDWLNGGAVAHPQTLFALLGLVVIPQSQLGVTP